MLPIFAVQSIELTCDESFQSCALFDVARVFQKFVSPGSKFLARSLEVGNRKFVQMMHTHARRNLTPNIKIQSKRIHEREQSCRFRSGIAILLQLAFWSQVVATRREVHQLVTEASAAW